MKITLENTGKRFTKDWVFRGVNYVFESGSVTSVMGKNGSGKSTLIKLIGGLIIPSEGKIHFSINNSEIPNCRIYSHLTIASPFISLIEDFDARENYLFQKNFKNYRNKISWKKLLQKIDFPEIENKKYREMSSGMQQRLKLILALEADVPLCLLDEPSSNLDENGVEWMKKLILEHSAKKTIIIASNFNPEETNFSNYKLILSQ